MSEKILGYILLVLGLMIMVGSAFSVYQVFTKKTKPVQLFNFSGINIDSAVLQPDLPNNIPAEFQQLANRPDLNKPLEIVPPELLNDSSNIFAHLIFMGFLLSAGGKIAQIGTYLLRPIQVKLKTEQQK